LTIYFQRSTIIFTDDNLFGGYKMSTRRDFLKTGSLGAAWMAGGGWLPGRTPQIDDTSILTLLESTTPFAGIPTFMRLPHTRDVLGADLIVMGVPFDSGTLNRPGTRYGPRAIREQSLYASAFQPVYPWKDDLTQIFKMVDFGDVVSPPGSGAVETMLTLTETAATDIFNAGAGLLSIGGDHTLPYGPVRAAAHKYGPLALIHIDSHQDSADSESLGERTKFICHGTFATDLAKEGHIDLARSSQVYIRTYMEKTPGGGYHVVYANEALQMGPEKLAEIVRERVGDTPVYLTLDIDGVDAAYAPGTGSPVPGGPSTGEMRRFLKALEGLNIVAADLVEVNPLYDPTGTTAIAGAFLAIDLLYLLGSARTR
jgi:agmatinase